jgi:hypothetical protein
MAMHKFPIPIAHDVPQTRPGFSLLRSIAIVILGISLAPLIAEGCAVCHAQWCRVLGSNAEASTPLFDSLHEGVESGHRSFWDAITPCFQRVPWSPKLVLLIGVILMMLGMLMLKL